ncbi:hypothetical protein VOLCADRAFT_97452 [Volvox carteri f. nagariensis]|uniref:Retrotransposon gag domain-containing protein n=1 Tax=Volvox carteri f. nagariensis TaxID=3068 RepID=D8UCS7_VOLCA|nr:uncharacterized protein VOLCADRAFT_97452 [Volvox carteri f. nagariensis]EFJ42441.1 hypothetical protein VOLCADRAFT_97452 [Volvox carteri f. nagariensis]|eukprot:XP_002956504.1 hypothetical protein VOLCADRAFT_97452 [Volvox carteri f. nagariensis]
MNNPSSDVPIPAVEHIAGRATGTTAGDGRNNVATERGLPAGVSDEVIRIHIPVPRLSIPADIKLSELSREVAPRVRAFVRDVRKYFDFVRSGNHGSIRCLFLANALEGAAKTWHDDWTIARLQYTSEQLLEALLIRFAPQIQTRELEALEKLAAGQHQMRANETVAAYHSRFEALIAPIPDLREVDRIFWFIRGLSAEFSGECATDRDGKPFQEYTKLVQHTLGVEARQLAKLHSQAQTRVLLHASTAVQDPAPIITDDGDLPAPEVRPRAATAAAGRNTAHQASGAGMRRVLQFRAGSKLFNGVDMTGQLVSLPGLPYTADVWYDPPLVLGHLDTEPHVSVLCAKVAASTGPRVPLIGIRVAGHSLTAMADSGASDDFISASIVEQLVLKPQPASWSSVTLADGGKQVILGQVSLHISLGPLRLNVHPYVLPKFTDAATFILGSATLDQYGAHLNYETHTLQLRKGTLCYKAPFTTAERMGEGNTSAAHSEPCVNFAAAAI